MLYKYSNKKKYIYTHTHTHMYPDQTEMKTEPAELLSAQT